MSGRGGWPLNVVLTPDGQPFFATTYLPKESGMLGHGIVGGKLHSGVTEGRLVADLADKILHGTPVSALPPIDHTDDSYIFDFREMLRLGITTDKLPEGYTLINEPYPFYHINIAVFWTIIISLLILCYVMLEISGLSRSHFYALVKKYGLTIPS